jgi:DNA-binding Lrp family transcriptional regulator
MMSVRSIPDNTLERRLLEEYQRALPLTPTPFADMAAALGVDEAEVLASLRRLQRSGSVSRVGPVLAPNRVGASLLAAMRVPDHALEAVAARISALPEVNHNYEREHAINLWFVVTGRDAAHVEEVLARIEAETGFAVLRLPMLESFKVDLGFPLAWN